VSLERFELLQLRHDDGIQTYHAREVTTARPVQVHLFAEGQTQDVLALMRRLLHMPDSERRRVLDRGTYQGVPYLVTDRLAGFASVREWIARNSPPTLDEQFAQLFESDPEPDLPDEPEPSPDPDPEPQPKPKFAPLLALVLGIGAALIFLLFLIAVVAFRPHQL
jgi:hypothetical protein